LNRPQPPPTAEKSSEEMSERPGLETLVYKGNPATLGPRFENWLELFDLAVYLNGVKDGQRKVPKGRAKSDVPIFVQWHSGEFLKNVRVHLHLNPEVKPVRQKLRTLGESVSKELKKQIELGILERVTDDIVPVLKEKEVKLGRDGKPSPVKAQTAPEVRITVDNRAQNNAFSRTHCPNKTIEELLYEANGSRLFSKLDII
jgi:hypothetical protein